MTESNLTKYQHILVVDLEATCCDIQSIPRHQMETIEIGAVMVDTASLETADHLNNLVRSHQHAQAHQKAEKIISQFLKNPVSNIQQRFRAISTRSNQK
jgi:inhibitor of KinA sporulation pathway (predicted exonuclease)